MKAFVLISILLVLFAVLFPALTAMGSPLRPPAIEDESAAGQPDDPISRAVPPAPLDSAVTVRLSTGGRTVELSMMDYLTGVVGAEMPALFEEEALKAQAVAARTYTYYKMSAESAKHPDADVCDDIGCCKAYASDADLLEKWGAYYGQYRDRIATAVALTDGVRILYEGTPIQAVFHSSSAGMTEASENIWPAALPYLRPVTSPETAADVPEYFSTAIIAFSDFRETILSVYPDAVLGEDKSAWIRNTVYTDSGRLQSVDIGGVTVTGPVLRSLFALRSTAIEVSVTDVAVVFRTTGYGHGVGMSQYGANVLAKQGLSYEEILAHYYVGVTLG